MNSIKLYLYSVDETDSAANKWDYGLLKEFCEKYSIEQVYVTSLPNDEKAFVAIPAPTNYLHEQRLSKELNKIGKITLFIMGGESGDFDVEQIVHPNISIWVQYPHDKHQKYNKFPQGAPQHFKDLKPSYKIKTKDLYFSGQINHNRRKQLAQNLPLIPNAQYKLTNGFTHGDTPQQYYSDMMNARVVPCPSGIVVLDSFRFYESLELLCLPIVDSLNPHGDKPRYFERLFDGTMPIQSVNNWSDLPDLMVNLTNVYPENMHRAVSWWIKFKRDLFNKIMEDMNEQG